MSPRPSGRMRRRRCTGISDLTKRIPRGSFAGNFPLCRALNKHGLCKFASRTAERLHCPALSRIMEGKAWVAGSEGDDTHAE
jgi:hypothetical protein